MSAPVVVGPRAMHFGERPDGTFVALIAVDELPESIDIRGVPRFLSREDMDGMTDFGILSARRQETYIVDGVQYDDENLGVTDANGVPVVIGNRKGNQEARLRALSKEYCSYWLRNGECDYTQQGCLYKHQMPLQLSVLDRLGLRDIPRWYRERYGLASLLAKNNPNSSLGGNGNGGKSRRSRRRGNPRRRAEDEDNNETVVNNVPSQHTAAVQVANQRSATGTNATRNRDQSIKFGSNVNIGQNVARVSGIVPVIDKGKERAPAPPDHTDSNESSELAVAAVKIGEAPPRRLILDAAEVGLEFLTTDEPESPGFGPYGNAGMVPVLSLSHAYFDTGPADYGYNMPGSLPGAPGSSQNSGSGRRRGGRNRNRNRASPHD